MCQSSSNPLSPYTSAVPAALEPDTVYTHETKPPSSSLSLSLSISLTFVQMIKDITERCLSTRFKTLLEGAAQVTGIPAYL